MNNIETTWPNGRESEAQSLWFNCPDIYTSNHYYYHIKNRFYNTQIINYAIKRKPLKILNNPTFSYTKTIIHTSKYRENPPHKYKTVTCTAQQSPRTQASWHKTLVPRVWSHKLIWKNPQAITRVGFEPTTFALLEQMVRGGFESFL